MRSGFWSYVAAAFNARPLGIFVPPNWIGLAAFAMLGWLNPGFWIIGAGVELAYLFFLATNKRFCDVVDGAAMIQARVASQRQIGEIISSLSPRDQSRYQTLAQRCQEILKTQKNNSADADIAQIARGLDRLLWIYVKLLRTSRQLERVVSDSPASFQRDLDQRIASTTARLADKSLTDELRASLQSTLTTLQSRRQNHIDAANKQAYVASEIQRIEEQVELVREQSVVAAESVGVSRQVDVIAAGLNTTNQWIKDQQSIFGSIGDELSDPGPILSVKA